MFWHFSSKITCTVQALVQSLLGRFSQIWLLTKYESKKLKILFFLGLPSWTRNRKCGDLFLEFFLKFSQKNSNKLVNLQQKIAKFHTKKKMIFKMNFGIIHFDVIPRRHLKLTYKGLLWSLALVSFSLPFLGAFFFLSLAGFDHYCIIQSSSLKWLDEQRIGYKFIEIALNPFLVKIWRIQWVYDSL